MPGEGDLLDLGEEDRGDERAVAAERRLERGLALAGRFIDALEQIADSYARSVDVGIERARNQDAAMTQFITLAKRHLGGG